MLYLDIIPVIDELNEFIAVTTLIQARCKLKEEYDIDVEAGIDIFNLIKKAALPLFLRMFDNGQVRISFLDHIKVSAHGLEVLL